MTDFPQQEKPKIIAILGQTATGKTDISLHIAERFRGEIISVDSRQVYKYLNVGTAKISPNETRGIPHHLIDIAHPMQRFTVADYTTVAEKTAREIIGRGNIPIFVGGTGYYMNSFEMGYDFPPLPEIPARISQMKDSEMIEYIKRKSPEDLEKIQKRNRRRLERDYLLVKRYGHIPPLTPNKRFNILKIVLERSRLELDDRISRRNEIRVRAGALEAEVGNLLSSGFLNLKRAEELGLEYKYTTEYIKGRIKTEEELIEILNIKTRQFARRQKTWFSKYAPGKTYHPKNDTKEIFESIKKFLEN